MSTAPRTLAEQLRQWPTERLAGLLQLRPDLATPAPRDSAQLAARAVVRTSVLRALEGLDALDLAVAQAVAQGGAQGGTTLEALGGVVHAAPASIESALGRLVDRALVWGTPGSWRPTTMVAELLALPEGPDAARVPGLLAELEPPARAILDHLETSGTDGSSAQARPDVTVESAGTPTEHLLARRLLQPRPDGRHLTVPWQVRLALRGGRSTREPVDVPPAPATSDRDPVLVDRIGAGAAFDLVRRTDLLLEHWGSRPPGVLRASGLGVRELRAAASLMHTETDHAALVIEVAAAAGLLSVGMADDLDAAWLPTDAFDAWQSRPTADRWAVLAEAWLTTPRLVALVGGREGTTPINALSEGLDRPWLPALRSAVLTELAQLPPGTTLADGTGPASLLALLEWRAPRRPAHQSAHALGVLAEATHLGVLARDGLTSFGRALVAGGGAAAALAPLLPQPVDHLLVQADLTAIAPGPLEQELARRVALVADVESRGGATVYRFSASSVRRAFDAGWSSAEIHEFLAATSRTPLPQALDYLVDDVARRFGTVRAGHAEAFLRSDDVTALTELLHHPESAGLRLRRLAPTVLISDVPLGTLLPRLRELGVAPVVEAPDGTVRVARPDVHRSRTPKSRPETARESARSAARAAAVVTAIRSGDRAAAERPSRGPARTPADVMALLRNAVETRSPVLIGYLDAHGMNSERLVRPERVEGGQLTAHDERSDGVLSFAIHRITTATAVSG